MLDIPFLGGLVGGLLWMAFSKQDDWYKVAARFTKWWAACLGILVIGALIGGAMMPGGPDDAHPGMLIVGVLWLISLTTMVWILVSTGQRVFALIKKRKHGESE